MEYLHLIDSFESYPEEKDDAKRIISEAQHLLYHEKMNFKKQVDNLPRRIDGDGDQFFMLEDVLPILRYFE